MQKNFLDTYDALSDSIYRFARTRLSDHDAALDLVQETFLKYWNHLARGGEVAHARALLFTIARRLIIDRYRAHRTTSLDALTEDAGFEAVEGHLPSPAQDAETAHVFSVLGRLPEEYRDVLLLRFVEGLEPREIAMTLNLSANAVSVRIHRGIEKLRALLHATDDHD